MATSTVAIRREITLTLTQEEAIYILEVLKILQNRDTREASNLRSLAPKESYLSSTISALAESLR